MLQRLKLGSPEQEEEGAYAQRPRGQYTWEYTKGLLFTAKALRVQQNLMLQSHLEMEMEMEKSERSPFAVSRPHPSPRREWRLTAK